MNFGIGTLVGVDAGFGVRAPDIGRGAGGPRLRGDGALIPGHRARLPAVHDTPAIDGVVAAGAASIGGPGRTRAGQGQEQCQSYQPSHVIISLVDILVGSRVFQPGNRNGVPEGEGPDAVVIAAGARADRRTALSYKNPPDMRGNPWSTHLPF